MVFKKYQIKDFFSDLSASIVVFFVAIPLCLGISLASGVPLISGLISGIIGGIVVGFLSNSRVSVSGPAAGLVTLVLEAISTLGDIRLFFIVVILAGVFQLILGFIRAGNFTAYFPSGVIEGMLTAIGIIIIIKQITVAIGYHPNNEGLFFAFSEDEWEFLFFSVSHLNFIHLGVFFQFLVSLAIQLVWEKVSFLKNLQILPSALIAVIVCTLLNETLLYWDSDLYVDSEFLVNIPLLLNSFFTEQIVSLNLKELMNPKIWIFAFTIGIVASIESTLSIEASELLIQSQNTTDQNRELKAQGVGNILCGLLGGLPITSVIVRTTANIKAGAKTKTSTILHGFWMLLSIFFLVDWLNKIPLSSLAAILFMVGYKLTKPKIFIERWKYGFNQFMPFISTVIVIVLTDLLKGVIFGFIVSIFFILRENLELGYHFKEENYKEGKVIIIHLAEEVSFLNKAAIKKTLSDLPENSSVIIDFSNNFYIDRDVILLIKNFLRHGAKARNINAKIRGHQVKHKLEEFNHLTIE